MPPASLTKLLLASILRDRMRMIVDIYVYKVTFYVTLFAIPESVYKIYQKFEVFGCGAKILVVIEHPNYSLKLIKRTLGYT